MSKKMTLYIEDSIAENVKRYAKNQKRSVSNVVNTFLKILQKSTCEPGRNAPLTKSLRGVLKDSQLTENDYHRYLEEKYL